MLNSQDAGGDPTREWRQECARDLARQYAIPPPQQVAAVFVLQWYLGAVARASAHLTVASVGLQLDLAPENMAIRRSAVGGYPVAVELSAETAWESAPSSEDRWLRATSEFHAHAQHFVAGYRPEVKLGSALRAGSIRDSWDSARASADPDWPLSTRRTSCCFIYPLPGVIECARCPRRTLSGQPRPF
ncbi:(2Fe-2S)-binding protein [Demetria terragena]|uniref:(2Fe-2S)-binding protein n=1 Tax=Demetria terragena TaxID=63959 RepID=UPI00037E4E2E|nr:(2Fe-2S)-binding protein [Demetria terragena]